MEQILVNEVQAFVENGRGGNRAGVVLDAGKLSSEQKQRVAAAVGFSETAFVSPSVTSTVRLDYFTPNKQIAVCGHATVATFSLLQSKALLPSGPLSFETTIGSFPIVQEEEDIFLTLSPPKFPDISGTGFDLPALFEFGADLPFGPAAPLIGSVGMPFLLIEVPTLETLKSLKPRLEGIREFSRSLELVGLYVFSRKTVVPGRHASVRMFAPYFGIDEESATGVGAGALGAFLALRLGVSAAEILIEQGHWMNPPSPSLLKVRIGKSNGDLDSVQVGGAGLVIGQRQVNLE